MECTSIQARKFVKDHQLGQEAYRNVNTKLKPEGSEHRSSRRSTTRLVLERAEGTRRRGTEEFR